MNKPIIAIFIASNLATLEEEKLIEKFSKYPCVILNAETHSKDDTLIVDAVAGAIPDDLAHLPDPETVIKKWLDYEAGLGGNVGGVPPVKEDPPVKEEPPKAENGGFTNNGGFGVPPVKEDKK